MTKGISIFVIVLIGFAIKAFSLSPLNRIPTHHELIKRLDSGNKKVEIYWSARQTNTRLPAIVYVHGVQDETRPGAVNLANGDLLSSTADLGYFAVAMSMPGYGQSSGDADFCGRESQLALQSTLRYLRNRSDVDSNNLAVSGISCGAIVGAMIADKEQLAAMILISGVYDFEDMYNKWISSDWPLQPEVMKYIEKSVLADGGLKTAEKFRSALPNASQFKMPVLLIAGGKDRIVDWAQSKALAKALQSNGHLGSLVLNPDGGHMISYEEWVKYATDFLHTIIKEE